MRSRAQGLLAGLALLGLALAAAAEPLVEQPYRIGFGNRIVTEAYVNGQGPFELLLDTASSQTVLYESVRKKLNLGPDGTEMITVIGLAGMTKSLPYRLTEFRLGREAINGLSVVVLPDPPRGLEPDGVVGIDVLERYLVELDARNRKLRLYAPTENASALYAGWQEIRLVPERVPIIDKNFWFFSSYFQQKYARTLFDLGAGLTIANWKLARKLGFHEYDFPPAPAALKDVLGKRSPVFLLKRVSINVSGRVWSETDAVVADASLFNLLEMADRPSAIIGPGLWKDESLAIDFVGQRLYIARQSRR